MTTALPPRASRRRAARIGIAGAALLAAATGASADDGIGGFLASIFGGHPQQAAPAPAVPAYLPGPARFRRARARPLIVRLHPSRPRLVVAQAPGKPVKVSIFEDRTLRRGDAVMMAAGVRVFAGSNFWPYRAEDFVALKDARSLDRDTTRVLAQLDKLPRG